MKKNKQKVFQFHSTGEFITEFDSLFDASNKLNLDVKSLISAINRGGMYQGFFFSYSKENSFTYEILD